MIIVALLFTALLLLGLPLAFAIGISGFSYFVGNEFLPLAVAAQRVVSISQSFPLLAVPFFILAGQLMNRSGITEHLLGFSKLLVSWIAGGLAHVTVVLSLLMGGVSGSAVADAAMQARVLGPAMVSAGLGRGYSAAVIAVGSLITATIPPSIGFILYGFMGNVSIGQLFIAGVVPGLLMTVVLIFTAWAVAKRRGYRAEQASPPRARDVWRGLWDAKWALLFPVLLLVTIRTGIFTPSEAGAFAVVYALCVGRFAYGKLGAAELGEALHQSVRDIGMISLIILLSAPVGYAIAFEQLPQSMTEWVVGLGDSPGMILFTTLTFLVLVGMVMEATVLVLLLTPILVPIVTAAGIDPVHYGVLMMTVVTLGGMTPPVGVAMYAVCGIMRCPTERYIVESIPFVGAVLALVAVLAIFPGLVMALPNWLG